MGSIMGVHPQITLVPAVIPKLPAKAVQRPPIPMPKDPQAPKTPPTIYLIRHGEKDVADPAVAATDNSDDSGPIGLNSLGFARANALPLVFNGGNTNPYDIRLILAMQPQTSGAQERPYETIWPLYLSLSQTENNYCLLDNTVHEESVELVAKRIQDYIASGSPGNILVCWEHKNLTNILEAFGFAGAPEYPKYFDVVWVLNPTSKLDESENQLQSGEDSKPLWSWNTITWWSEGTSTDLALDEDSKKWVKKEKAPIKNAAGEMVTYSKDLGPTCTWEPYEHHQLAHPKTKD